MLPKLVLVYFPAAALAAYLGWLVLFNAFPLSPWGAFWDNQPHDAEGYVNQLLYGVGPLWYLVAYGALSLWPAPRPWLRAAIAAGVGIAMVAAAFANAFASGFSRGRPTLGAPGLPLVLLDRAACAATAPLRSRHYLRHLDDADERAREIASREVHEDVYERWIRDDRPVPARIQRVLARALRSPHEHVRKDLGETFARSAPWTDEAVALAVAALEDPAPGVRAQTAAVLGATYDEDERLVAALLARAETDPDAAVRLAAATTLDKIARTDPRFEAAMLRAIDRGEPHGARFLHTVRPDDPRVPIAFRTFLADPDPKVRRAWIDAIADVSTKGDDFFDPEGFRPQLVEGLKASDPGRLDLRAALLHALADADPGVRDAAADRLAAIWPEDPEVHLALARALADPDANVRRGAAAHLGRAVSGDVRVQRALLAAVADRDPGVRIIAAGALADARPTDGGVRLAIVAALRADAERYSDTRQRLIEAVDVSTPFDPAVVSAIAALLSERSVAVRLAAVELLPRIAAADPSAQVALARALRDGDRFEAYDRAVGDRAADALARCRPLSPEARAVVEPLARGADAEAARRARDVLELARQTAGR